MAEFIAKGIVELRNVTFYIEASSEAEAMEKARLGHYSDRGLHGEIVNWTIDPETVAPNV